MSSRSHLYVPGHRPDRFAKAEATGVDAVIFDLEDSVPVSAKDEARTSVAAHLAAAPADGVARLVRVNTGDRGLADVAAVVATGAPCRLVVPKATAAALAEVAAAAPGLALVALVESAVALRELDAIAASANVATIALGEVDLAADLGLLPEAPEAVWWAIRIQVVAACAAAGLAPPIGPVETVLDDPEALRRSTAVLRAAGFGGRQAIHPNQVAVIAEVFTPTQADRDAAQRLLDLAAAADGGVCVDDHGRMVDEAVLRSARRILGHAG